MKRAKPSILLCMTIMAGLTSLAQKTIPPLNKIVLDYVNTQIGKKVDSGECWDLANEALKKANAKWDLSYNYGKPVNPAKDSIFPGDLIQFEDVELTYQKEGKTYKELMPHHTAIVWKVMAPGSYQLAHQNTGQHGRKVGISDFNLNDMKKGKARFYRPQSN
jgi:hypothetical protein